MTGRSGRWSDTGGNIPGLRYVVGGERADGYVSSHAPMQGGGLSTIATSPERLRDDLVRLVHRGADVRGFSIGAARILARAVPFEGVCVLTMDPATLVPTGAVSRTGRRRRRTAAEGDRVSRGGLHRVPLARPVGMSCGDAQPGHRWRPRSQRAPQGHHGPAWLRRRATRGARRRRGDDGRAGVDPAIGSRAVLARPHRARGSGDATARRGPAAGGAARPRLDRPRRRRGRCGRRRARPGRLDRVHGRGRRGLDRGIGRERVGFRRS